MVNKTQWSVPVTLCTIHRLTNQSNS